MPPNLSMNVNDLMAASNNTTQLAQDLSDAKAYGSGNGLAAEHFGNVPSVARAGTATVEAINALVTSLGTGATHMANVARALEDTAKMTKETDAENEWKMKSIDGVSAPTSTFSATPSSSSSSSPAGSGSTQAPSNSSSSNSGGDDTSKDIADGETKVGEGGGA